MKPKAGKAGSLVSPTEPKEALEADTADPGEAAQMKAGQAETKSGKYGSEKVKPHKPPESEEEKKTKTAWIEIEMVDEADKPVPGAAYQITLPDGSVDSGTLDQKGWARVEGFEPGSCKVTFPDLDKSAWEKI
jgi:type VI secretion system secreted protein VgrG